MLSPVSVNEISISFGSQPSNSQILNISTFNNLQTVDNIMIESTRIDTISGFQNLSSIQNLTIDNNDELDNGSIIGNTIVIKCAENAIKVNVLQRPGKKIMSSKEVLNGWKVIKGQKMQIIN